MFGTFMRRGIAALTIITGLTSAHAAFPEKSIRIIVNSVAGGGADILARSLAEELASHVGQAVIIENKAGGGGAVAAQALRASGDDHTFLLADSGMLAINPLLQSDLGYDPLRDFAPIGTVASFPVAMVASRASGFRTLPELVARAKTNPGSIGFASTGIGSPQHLAGELLQAKTGIRLNHVPYRGGAQALTDVISGQIPVAFIGLPPIVARIKSGEVVGLGVASTRSSPLAPELRTLGEQIGTSLEAEVWFGLYGPAKAPQETIEILSKATNAVLADAAFQKRLLDRGYVPFGGTPGALKQLLDDEQARWRPLVAAIARPK